MTSVKICGLTNLEDARWAWRCGADLLGFVFVPASPRCMQPKEVARICQQLAHEGCSLPTVGVFADAPIGVVRGTAQECALHIVQLHGTETPADARAVGLPVIIARRVRDRIPIEELTCYSAWAFLLDTYDPQRLGGTGQPWAWELVSGQAMEGTRVLIAGGLTPDNVALAVRVARPWGVDVSSGVEAHPGKKDPARVQIFIQNAKEARS